MQNISERDACFSIKALNTCNILRCVCVNIAKSPARAEIYFMFGVLVSGEVNKRQSARAHKTIIFVCIFASHSPVPLVPQFLMFVRW